MNTAQINEAMNFIRAQKERPELTYDELREELVIQYLTDAYIAAGIYQEKSRREEALEFAGSETIE